jgi:hypothetical protein
MSEVLPTGPGGGDITRMAMPFIKLGHAGR